MFTARRWTFRHANGFSSRFRRFRFCGVEWTRMLHALRNALDGISVVALATNIPGPLAAGHLRLMGAQVVKIEPARGDTLEESAPHWYAAITTGLEILRLDLRDEKAMRALDAHLRYADLVITAMRASSLLRVGFDWKTLHAKYPRLCHIAICGEAPPHDDRAGHDLTYQARAGTIAPPVMPRTLVGDMAAAERAVAAAVTALYVRSCTNEAMRLDVSIVEAATDFAAPFRYGLTAPNGALGGALPTYRIYAAQNGYVALAALEPHFIQRLATMLETESTDAETLERIFAQRTAREWERLAETYDVPLAAVREEVHA